MISGVASGGVANPCAAVRSLGRLFKSHFGHTNPSFPKDRKEIYQKMGAACVLVQGSIMMTASVGFYAQLAYGIYCFIREV